jgi:prepilin peptidase CpaA
MAIADCFLILLMAICVYTDIKSKKIYNVVLFPAATIGLASNFLSGGVTGGITGIKGMMLGMALLLVPFILGGMGAGDVKLLGVVGAFKGPGFVWTAFIFTAIVGGVISVIVMVKSGEFPVRFRAAILTLFSAFGVIPQVDLLDSIYEGSVQTFPYAVAIAAGTALAYVVR